eukprot:s3397_g5.t1
MALSASGENSGRAFGIVGVIQLEGQGLLASQGRGRHHDPAHLARASAALQALRAGATPPAREDSVAESHVLGPLPPLSSPGAGDFSPAPLAEVAPLHPGGRKGEETGTIFAATQGRHHHPAERPGVAESAGRCCLVRALGGVMWGCLRGRVFLVSFRFIMKFARWLFAATLLVGAWSFKTSIDNSDDGDDDEEEVEEYGRFADLAVAFPIVISNLSNFTSLISGKYAPHDENLTHWFGMLENDMEMLFDKVSGFFNVLHASMEGQDGPTYCPTRSLRHIKECLIVASCLIQREVPQYIEMAMYASYLEMLDRFVEIGYGLLERAILLESPNPEHHPDAQVPDKYHCDAFGEPVIYDGATATYNETSLLQGDAASALEMSAALGRATDFTHRLLDAHTEGASMESMVQQITGAWRPFCHRWSCDPENFWDIHYASHQQTVMLMQTDSPSTLRREIRQRLKLERRVRDFMVDRYEWFGSLMQSTERSSVQNFFDVTARSEASVDTWKAYGRSGKAAMLRFAVPFTRAVARFNETRATQSFDQVEYQKFKAEQTTPARGDPSARALLAAREHGKGFMKKVGKGIKKAAKKVGKAVAKVATVVAKAVVKAVAYLATLFACLGDLFEFVTVGYAKTIATGIDFGAGITVGDMLPGDIDTDKLNDVKASVNQLMKGEPPDVWISIDVAFAIGANTPSLGQASWVGFAIGGGACCSTSSCGAYFSVGALGTVNTPILSPACVFGAVIGDPVTGFKCTQVFGASITAFCCNFNLLTGKNDCR